MACVGEKVGNSVFMQTIGKPLSKLSIRHYICIRGSFTLEHNVGTLNVACMFPWCLYLCITTQFLDNEWFLWPPVFTLKL